MRRKLFHVICAVCASGFLTTAVFGKMPTAGDLLGIAKESFEKGLLEVDASRLGADSCKDLSDEDYTRQGVIKGSEVDRKFYETSNLWDHCAREVLSAYASGKYREYSECRLRELGSFLSGGNPKLNEEVFFLNPSAQFSEDAIKRCNEILYEWVREELVKATHSTKFGEFFVEKMKPFLEETLKRGRLFDAVANTARDLGHFVRTLQANFKKDPSAEINAKIIQSFKEKKEAFLKAGSEKLDLKDWYGRYVSIGVYIGADHFWEQVASLECVEKLNIARRKLSFENFKPMDFKGEEEKAKDNFDILGLDMDRIVYPNPFKRQARTEQVGGFLKEEVKCFVEEIRTAYEHIGTTAERNFVSALASLCQLTKGAWECECFDPKPVIQTFEEALLKCDIEVLIDENKPRSDNNKLHEGFKRLKEEKSIDTRAVEETIYDAYIARFENDVKKCFYALVTALRNLKNHQISFIETVRRMEKEVYEDTEKGFEETMNQVTEWRKKQEEYEQVYQLSKANFYKTFFGEKKKDWQGHFVAGDTKQLKCLEILEARLMDYGLWEPIVPEKKEELKEPNNKRLNTIIEELKEPETVKSESIPQEYTQLTNEKRLPTRKRRGQNDG